MSVDEVPATQDTLYKDLRKTSGPYWAGMEHMEKPAFRENLITYSEPPIYKVHPLPKDADIKDIIALHD